MPIILLSVSLMILNFRIQAQNPIGTSLHPIVGDLYHTGGNIGIGTQWPKELLHIFSSSGIPAIRLENYNAKQHSIWNIQNNTSFILSYTFDGIFNTKFILTPSGQLVLGTEMSDASAIMQMESTNKGLLIPRMTTAKKNAIGSPANGLLVYDTDLKKFSYYDTASETWQNTARSSDLSDYLLINDFNNSVAGNISTNDTAHWNTAYNFSQNFSETDPIFSAHLSSDITATDTANWNAAYSNTQNLTETDPVFTAHLSSDITEQDTAHWNTAYAWGNHTLAGYIKADSQDTLSNKKGNISMWNNDAGYLTAANINNLWQENGSGNIYRNNGNVGIGTKIPEKPLEIYSVYNTGVGSLFEKSTIRLTNKKDNYNEPKDIGPGPGPTPSPKIYKWDIENSNDTLKFNYIAYNLPLPIGTNATPETKFTFSGNGTLTAAKFVGDGSGLTNLSGAWLTNGNNIYYNTGNVGIGTENPDAKIQVNNGAIKISGSSSLGQGARFQINTGASTGHTFLTLNNDNGEQFAVYGSGLVRAKKIKVQSNWADFIFNKSYYPMPIGELETYIKQNKHLPDIPNEKQIKTEGLDIGEMQKLQMQKIEELTLYIIQLNKENESLKKRIIKLENKQP